jgi:hypothetical protein
MLMRCSSCFCAVAREALSSFQDWHVRPLHHPSKPVNAVIVNRHRLIELDGQESSVKIPQQVAGGQWPLPLSFVDPFRPSHIGT